MRTFSKQLKTTMISVAVGLAIFGLIAYSLMLFSVTQSIALNGQSTVAPAR